MDLGEDPSLIIEKIKDVAESILMDEIKKAEEKCLELFDGLSPDDHLHSPHDLICNVKKICIGEDIGHCLM